MPDIEALPAERPVQRELDVMGADAETLVDMGIIEPPPEPAPHEPLLQENPS